jgi:hypothetical protein
MMVSVPGTPWWLSMLQVFVPVVSALGLAVLGYYFTLKSDLRSKSTEARLNIQRQALEDAHAALSSFWNCAARLLRYPFEMRLAQKELISKMEDASVGVTVSSSRLADQELADDMIDWHFAVANLLTSRTGLSADEVNRQNAGFTAVSNRRGQALRELSATGEKPVPPASQKPAPVLDIEGQPASG